MLTIIGCGNLNRSDDGVGVVVVQRLAERLRRHPVPGVQAFDCGTGGVDVMFRAKGSDALLVIDAARSGSEPGAIYDVPGEALAQDHEPSYSLHDFRWDHALAAGRKIFKENFPSQVRVWLVEASSIDYGLELSAPVARAADVLYRRALDAIAEYAVQRHAGPTELELHRGSIRVRYEDYARLFDGRDGALLIEREGQICVVPVEQLDGGLLVKQRNARGDRVIHAQEFLALRGADDAVATVTAEWDPELGGLAFTLPPGASS
jgi:hydrogenase maturation protease